MPEPAAPREWAKALFRLSPLKQRKLAEIVACLGETNGLVCLDLGSDNGVVSLLLRERGGEWSSADLTEQAVASTRGLVGERVWQLRDERLPFEDGAFDRLVVVDMLEHVQDDAAFVRELARVTKAGGRLIVNTPHLKRTALRRLRHALGQTDEKHGHLRPGYEVERLRLLLAPEFELEQHRTYSRFFSEAVDTALNWAMERLGKASSAKGMVVTSDDLGRHRRLFRAYSLVHPFVLAMTRLDALVPASGYMLIASATRRASSR